MYIKTTDITYVIFLRKSVFMMFPNAFKMSGLSSPERKILAPPPHTIRHQFNVIEQRYPPNIVITLRCSYLNHINTLDVVQSNIRKLDILPLSYKDFAGKIFRISGLRGIQSTNMVEI